MQSDLIWANEALLLKNRIEAAWHFIAPSFPLDRMVAVNPLKGFEELPFNEAVAEAEYFFNSRPISARMHIVNRETIKWCQAYFDNGQSTIQMPLREYGFYTAFKKLSIFDQNIPRHKKNFILNLPNDSLGAIENCLNELKLEDSQVDWFLKTLLATLSGWASYIKFKTDWEMLNPNHKPLLAYDYLAIRLILCVLFLEKENIFLKQTQFNDKKELVHQIEANEKKYHEDLIKKIYFSYKNLKEEKDKAKAQFIFCIDVRSEPLRRAIESEGDYETFGYAGFFGLPVCIKTVDAERHDNCPVLIKPLHTLEEHIDCHDISEFKKRRAKKKKVILARKIYQSLKYNFTTPFLLAELLGFWSGIWMMLKTFFPEKAFSIKNKTNQEEEKSFAMSEIGILEGISFSDQVSYAESMLRAIDLVDDFSPLIIVCGHGSMTQNNAYGSSLDCGACGGRDGSSNARLMSVILNTEAVRHELKKRGIAIPLSSKFIPAMHNTTTDEVTLFSEEAYFDLEVDLKNAQFKNNMTRSKNLFSTKNIKSLSQDWAQTRPEWGLAKNGAFIVGPRAFTKQVDLEGRCFLHSYECQKDEKLEILTSILTAPMIVAQWINCQYLFSTVAPINYGAGSKITQNITGKVGVMQGNASDLMHGLPLQSTHQSDTEAFHEPIRLMTIVYAPKHFITTVISENKILEKLAKNAWVKFTCIDPLDNTIYQLQSNLTWESYESLCQC